MRIFILSVLLSFVIGLKAQIGYLQMERVAAFTDSTLSLQNWNSEAFLDTLNADLLDAFEDFQKEWTNVITDNYCMTLEQQRALEKKLTAEQEALTNAETLYLEFKEKVPERIEHLNDQLVRHWLQNTPLNTNLQYVLPDTFFLYIAPNAVNITDALLAEVAITQPSWINIVEDWINEQYQIREVIQEVLNKE